jgi:hypothetical protein
MALPPMGPMSPPPPTLGGPQPNMGPSPMPPMGMGMPPPPPPTPPMAAPMAPPTINPSQNGGQSFGGDAGGRKTFSQYLQSMNTSFPPTPTAPPPMAGGIGGGAPSMPPLAMMGGGAVPRQTMIGREPHRLAYINPGEEMMLRASGGTGEPGPMGVPAFRGGGYGFGGFGSPGEAPSGGVGYGLGDIGGVGPGEIDPGFIDALAEAAVDNSYFDAFETDPDKLADQVAFESISSQVPDIIGPNAPVSNVDAQNAVALATEAFDPYKDVVDFNTASTLESSPIATEDVGVNTLDEAFLNQYNDPNLSVNIPGTNVSMPDVSSLLGGVVRPDMMPPGYQPTPDEPNFFDIVGDQGISSTLGAPIAPDYGNLNIDMGTDNLGGVGVGVEDPTFGYNIDMESDPFPGASAFTGLDAQMPTGIQDPTQVATGIVDSPQLDESERDAIVAARASDTLNPQGPTFTPSIPELTGPALAEATMGAPIGDPAMDRREAAFGDMNTPETDFGTLEASLSSSPSNIGLPSNYDPSQGAKNYRQQAEAMRVAEAGIQNQKDIEANKGKFSLASLLPGSFLFGTPESRKQAAINQVLSQSGGSGLFGTGIGGATGVLGTGATSFNAVYDKDGNFVGSQGVNADGETVSYSGNMQSNNGYFDSDGKNISQDIESYQDEIGGQGSPGGIDTEYNPCQPGFELDPETGTCVPIDVAEPGPPEMTPIIRPITPPITSPGVPTPTPVVSPVLRMPKQFNMGGATSGSNLDGAISRLLSSMS